MNEKLNGNQWRAAIQNLHRNALQNPTPQSILEARRQNGLRQDSVVNWRKYVEWRRTGTLVNEIPPRLEKARENLRNSVRNFVVTVGRNLTLQRAHDAQHSATARSPKVGTASIIGWFSLAANETRVANHFLNEREIEASREAQTNITTQISAPILGI